MAIEHESPAARAGWFRYANLKIEAAVFLLLLISFAAVLGQSAITEQKIALSPGSSHFAPYTFSDAQDGGASVAVIDDRKPLTWSCKIRPGAEYPFCGYGLQLNVAHPDQGMNLSHIKTITLRFNYHGAADRMRLAVQTGLPPHIRQRTKVDGLASAVDFPVVNGRNEVTLPLEQLAPEGWFLIQHHLSESDAKPDFSRTLNVALVTDAGKPSDLDASIEEIVFEGAFLTTAQWYLVILGVWLVATGGFLVYRFLHMRRSYEIRQRRQAQEAQVLAEARAAAEAASSAKSQFLSNMSHELRTPLNAIIGYAHWFQNRAAGDKEREAASTILSSGEHLLAVISDILDIAKIEAGKLELLAAPFDLHDCVTSVANMVRPRAEEKGLRFEVLVSPDVPRMVVADQKRVRQVLINLLGNAIKFTSDGQVALQVSLISPDAEGWRIGLVVEDTGIGIPAEHAASIFRPFEQVGNALDRSGGTGLGLSITKQIVDLMHGEIWVESAPGKGSRFMVEVLVAAADPGEAPRLGHAPLAKLPAPQSPTEPAPAVALDPDTLQKLLQLARTGNLRALRRAASALKEQDPVHAPFADQLDGLCSTYQSPAVLRLIETLALQDDAR